MYVLVYMYWYIVYMYWLDRLFGNYVLIFLGVKEDYTDYIALELFDCRDTSDCLVGEDK